MPHDIGYWICRKYAILEAVLNLSCDDWSEKDQKIAQSTHENGYIKPRKTFWRNSKQLLK